LVVQITLLIDKLCTILRSQYKFRGKHPTPIYFNSIDANKRGGRPGLGGVQGVLLGRATKCYGPQTKN